MAKKKCVGKTFKVMRLLCCPIFPHRPLTVKSARVPKEYSTRFNFLLPPIRRNYGTSTHFPCKRIQIAFFIFGGFFKILVPCVDLKFNFTLNFRPLIFLILSNFSATCYRKNKTWSKKKRDNINEISFFFLKKSYFKIKITEV